MHFWGGSKQQGTFYIRAKAIPSNNLTHIKAPCVPKFLGLQKGYIKILHRGKNEPKF